MQKLLILLGVLVATAAHASYFTVSGEYLYWTAQQRSMEYVLLGVDPFLEFTDVVSEKEKAREAHYDWNSGFRVGIGCVIDECCYLSPQLEYTHFQTEGSSKAHPSFDSVGIAQAVPSFPPVLPPFTLAFFVNGAPTVQEASSKVKLHIDYLDLNFLSAEYCCGCLSWNWGFGLRGAVLKSKWNTDYLLQFGNTLTLELFLGPQFTNIDWKYSAGGIKFDGGFAYDFGCGFRVYQEVVGALMFGRLRNSVHSVATSPAFGSFTICDVHNAKYKIVPVLHSETGLDWSYCWGCQYLLRAKVAFEYIKWFQVGENKFYSIPQGARFKDTSVDLDLYGLTAALSFTF